MLPSQRCTNSGRLSTSIGAEGSSDVPRGFTWARDRWWLGNNAARPRARSESVLLGVERIGCSGLLCPLEKAELHSDTLHTCRCKIVYWEQETAFPIGCNLHSFARNSSCVWQYCSLPLGEHCNRVLSHKSILTCSKPLKTVLPQLLCVPPAKHNSPDTLHLQRMQQRFKHLK